MFISLRNGRGSHRLAVDFQIKSVGWAIECLRDGNGLNEHIKRFQPPDGKYYRWVKSGEVQDYILLDFRQSMP
jgi:hypothetical protein